MHNARKSARQGAVAAQDTGTPVGCLYREIGYIGSIILPLVIALTITRIESSDTSFSLSNSTLFPSRSMVGRVTVNHLMLVRIQPREPSNYLPLPVRLMVGPLSLEQCIEVRILDREPIFLFTG